MHINSNLNAVITNNVLLRNESAFSLSTAKLSSGYKINTAGDDPTGYAISGRMRQQLAALERADVNATTGKSVLETADGALSEVNDMLQRLNELSIKASNGTMSASDRADIQQEVEQLTAEIERISDQIELNGQKLLDGHLENHGYCENNASVQVEEYNDKLNAGKYTVEIRGREDEPNLKLAISVTDSSGRSVIKIGDTSKDVTADENKNCITVPYPKYLDPERLCEIGENGVAETSARYDDPSGRGSVKICEDGSQYITVKGTNGEEITLYIDHRAVGGGKGSYTSGTGETYDMNNWNINLYDTKKLEITLTGKGAMDLHIGANEEEVVSCSLPRISLERLDIDKLDMTTKASAQYSIDRVSYALSYVSSARARIGAYTNRVEHSISYLAASNENLNASMSRIQDTDMAEEMTNYASQQVLVQAATSMLAQANQAPEQALQLIQ